MPPKSLSPRLGERVLRRSFAALGLSVGLLVLGCHPSIENGFDTFDYAPTIPPLGSVRFDLSHFRDRTPAAGGTTVGWRTALERVAYMDSTITRLLVLPDATIRAAATQTPSRRNDVWRWPYDIVVGGVRYTGQLLGGQEAPTLASFRMVLNAPNANPPVTDRTLLNGDGDYGAASGLWYVYDPTNASTVPAVTIRYARQDNAVNVQLTSPEGSWAYEEAPDEYEIRLVAADTEHSFSLIWNPVSGRGKVTFHGSNACWDAALRDVAC